jgi:hypothetical protein
VHRAAEQREAEAVMTRQITSPPLSATCLWLASPPAADMTPMCHGGTGRPRW